MDVKFINPFLYGTIEILEKMAFIKPVAGKPFLKTDDSACGDVSGIIGMTGDISGSIALTFDKECIIDLTNQMLGENHTEINNEVLDTAGKLTNIISGAARKIMEKDNLKVFAAIPTIIYGRGHTVRHAIKGPSIILPFQTGERHLYHRYLHQIPTQTGRSAAKSLGPAKQSFCSEEIRSEGRKPGSIWQTIDAAGRTRNITGKNWAGLKQSGYN
jgi:chemotaxis protein CheX